MKRLLLILPALVLALALATPALAHHTEFAWETRSITVTDAVRPTMRSGHLLAESWLRARQRTFEEYTAAGFDFSFTRGDPALCAQEWPVLPSGTILLCRVPHDGIEPTGYMEGNVGIARVPIGSRHFLCHEIGHVLGLGHRPESGTCMNVAGLARHIDAHDIEALIGSTAGIQ